MAERSAETFDTIVVGGGSSGCVAAARLADAGQRVLLLEAGHSHRHPLLDMPPGIFKLIDGSKFITVHTTEPQEHLGGRRHDIPQANVLGGGSSVNAQVYMRGRPSDYDAWHDLLRGNNDGADWSWNAVLPIFTGMEDNARLAGERHGVGGPLKVSDPGHIDTLSKLWVQAVQTLGEPYNADFNGPSQRGVGFYQFTNRAGRRCSSAYAYLTDKVGPQPTVRLGAMTERVIIEKGRARGVLYRQDGNRHQAMAANVILAAGALVTPKLLMLSGVGPPEALREHEIAVTAASPGVGQNLIDHPEVPIISRVKGREGYYRQGVGWRMVKNGLQFKLFGSGLVTSAGVEAGAFVNPSDPAAPATIQAFCVPIIYRDRDTKHLVRDGYGLTVTTVVVKPRSRGRVWLASADPAAMPRVSPNLLGDPADLREMIAGQRFFLRAFSAAPLGERIATVLAPAGEDPDDETLAAHCRQMVKTNYHPAGTARMGADGDPLAVLDARLRVRGVEGLSVCDMSAVPDINAGNTNAPAMMLGSRCADFVLQDPGGG